MTNCSTFADGASKDAVHPYLCHYMIYLHEYLAFPTNCVVLCNYWIQPFGRGTMNHRTSEKPKKEMMSGCKIHTPYLFAIPPVMLLSALCQVSTRYTSAAATHKGMIALPA